VVRRARRGGEAGTGSMEVSGKGSEQINAEELGSPMSRGEGVVGGTILYHWRGRRKGLSVGGVVASRSMSRGADRGCVGGGTEQEAVNEMSKTAKVVKGGRQEEHSTMRIVDLFVG
jgi:hypothetical protein